MTSSISSRLQAAVKKRDDLATKVERLKGRLQAAEQSLATVEQECRDKNIDPENIEEALGKLQEHYDGKVAELESKLAGVQTALEPFEN